MATLAASSRVLRRVLAMHIKCSHMAKTKSGTLRPFSSSLATEIIRNTTYTSPKFLFPALKRSFVCTPSSSPPSSSGSSSLELDPHRQVRVSHILLPPGSESTIEDFKSQILDGNATLESLAKDHSTCPSGASRGGDIGWIPKGRTVPEFELASYSTPKGSLSTCSTQFGVHLIQVTEERIAVDVGNCSVHEFAEILSSVSVDQDLLDDIQFVDVREPHEVDIVSLPHFQVLPLGNFQDWAPRLSSLLDPTKKTYVLCHHGMRSMQASQFFLENGFSKVWNISGGIDAYARGVDNNLQRY